MAPSGGSHVDPHILRWCASAPGEPLESRKPTVDASARPAGLAMRARVRAGQPHAANSGGAERTRRIENRVRHRTDMGVDALEVLEHVEVQGAGFDALRGVVLQACNVARRVLVLEIAKGGFFLQQ